LRALRKRVAKRKRARVGRLWYIVDGVVGRFRGWLRRRLVWTMRGLRMRGVVTLYVFCNEDFD
jgi:hypothetical protein